MPVLALLTAALVAGCGGDAERSEALGPAAGAPAKSSRPDVLFIAIDDLRAELGCYGAPGADTPNIDRLAASGMRFTGAYCQQALCNPSRASVLTGRRPESTGVVDLATHFRERLPDVVTLPQAFRAAGYRTLSLGKIYHGNLLDPPSWSQEPFLADRKRIYALEAHVALNRPRHKGPATERADVPDDAYRDGQVTQHALELLEEEHTQPLFLAVGFYKPHLPLAAPNRYWQLHSPEGLVLAENGDPPQDAPPAARLDFGELRRYLDIPAEGPLPLSSAREIVLGYRACVSYVDAQVGSLLDALERSGRDEHTVVVLWSDHGWYLGEHGMWAKTGVHEQALHAPLIVRAPGSTRAGAECGALVELVDLYPTLCELAGVEAPPGLEGTSFVPLLREPQRPWKSAVFSEHHAFESWAVSLRTPMWRFSLWRARADGRDVGLELYDHRHDPGENVNLAGRPEHATTVAELREQLERGWRGALPAGLAPDEQGLQVSTPDDSKE